MADTIMSIIDKWQIPPENIIGISWDTTTSNTGVHKGSATRVEVFLKHACLWLACRHHTGELHIKHVDIRIRGETTGSF